MRASWFVAVVLAAAGAAGCGSSDPSTPQAACNSLASTACNRFFVCFPTQAAGIYGTEAACGPILQQQICTNITCPAGKTYHGSQATQCINDYKAQSCTDVGAGVTPASCNTVCS
jgi:hypothetical protein